LDRIAILEHYKRTVARHDGIEIKGAKTSYTAINGNMFSFVDDQTRLCLRFSEHRKSELNDVHKTTDVLQYGAVMRGYIPLPDSIISDASALNQLFSESLDFARGLKPKPTKKKPT
jgi:hypothetical protein